jgi:site-specific recombinase XerD
MKQNKNIGNLSRIKAELERRLIAMRYSKVTISHHMRIYGWVEEFLKANGTDSYSKEAGQRFLAEYALQSRHSPSLFKTSRIVVRRMDEIIENKLFTPCFRQTKLECPTRFIGWLDKYLESLMKRGFRQTTLTSHKRYAGQLLVHLPDTVKSLKKLSAADLYDVFTKYEWPHVGYFAARGFLSFLFETGVTKSDLSVCVPRPKVPRTLPSVYSGEEVARLLSATDRTTSLGKRDYAIITLAAQTGLRAVDIADLEFADIDWRSSTINISQEKTKRGLALSLPAEAGNSVADYILHGRPESKLPSIFLKMQQPVSKMSRKTVGAIVQKYAQRSGINDICERRKGFHGFRRAFGGRLLEAETPIELLSEILGHAHINSSKPYLSANEVGLRSCALSISTIGKAGGAL